MSHSIVACFFLLLLLFCIIFVLSIYWLLDEHSDQPSLIFNPIIFVQNYYFGLCGIVSYLGLIPGPSRAAICALHVGTSQTASVLPKSWILWIFYPHDLDLDSIHQDFSFLLELRYLTCKPGAEVAYIQCNQFYKVLLGISDLYI